MWHSSLITKSNASFTTELRGNTLIEVSFPQRLEGDARHVDGEYHEGELRVMVMTQPEHIAGQRQQRLMGEEVERLD